MSGCNYWTSVSNFYIVQRLDMNMNPVKLVGFIPDYIKTELKEVKEIQRCRGSIIIQKFAEDLNKGSLELTKDDLASAAIGKYSGYLAHVIKRRDKSLIHDVKELILTVDESDINTVFMVKYHVLVLFAWLAEISRRQEASFCSIHHWS